MRPRVLRAEIERLLLNQRSLIAVCLFLSITVFFVLFAGIENHLELFSGVAFVLLPSMMVVWGAFETARPRTTDLHDVLTTAPASQDERFLGTAVAVTLLTAAGMVLAGVLAWALVYPLAVTGVTQFLPWVLWGLGLGIFSGFLGGLVGSFVQRDAVSGIAAGSLIYIAWTYLAFRRGQVLSWATSEPHEAILEGLIHTSPITWGIEAIQPRTGALWPGWGTELLFVASMALGMGLMAWGVTHLTHTTEQGRARLLGSSLLVIGLLLSVGTLTAWDHAAYPAPQEHLADEPGNGNGWAVENLTINPEDGRFFHWGTSAQAVLEMDVHSVPEDGLLVEEIQLESQRLNLAPRLDPPMTLEGPHTSLQVPVRVTPTELTPAYPLEATLFTDGGNATAKTSLQVHAWATSTVSTGLTAVALLSVAATSLARLPKRWNEW